MRNLIIKLGLLKIDQSEYLNMLAKLHDNVATMILKPKGLNEDEYNKAICEIKIFLWVFAIPILKENLQDELYKKTMKFFRSNIIFSTIDEFQYSDEYMTNMLNSRFEFYKSGIQEPRDSYFQQLKTLWFEQPFYDLAELRENYLLDFDIMGQLETQQLYIQLAPAYTKSLKRIIKITKK